MTAPTAPAHCTAVDTGSCCSRRPDVLLLLEYTACMRAHNYIAANNMYTFAQLLHPAVLLLLECTTCMHAHAVNCHRQLFVQDLAAAYGLLRCCGLSALCTLPLYCQNRIRCHSSLHGVDTRSCCSLRPAVLQCLAHDHNQCRDAYVEQSHCRNI